MIYLFDVPWPCEFDFLVPGWACLCCATSVCHGSAVARGRMRFLSLAGCGAAPRAEWCLVEEPNSA